MAAKRRARRSSARGARRCGRRAWRAGRYRSPSSTAATSTSVRWRRGCDRPTPRAPRSERGGSPRRCRRSPSRRSRWRTSRATSCGTALTRRPAGLSSGRRGTRPSPGGGRSIELRCGGLRPSSRGTTPTSWSRSGRAASRCAPTARSRPSSPSITRGWWRTSRRRPRGSAPTSVRSGWRRPCATCPSCPAACYRATSSCRTACGGATAARATGCSSSTSSRGSHRTRATATRRR